MCKLCERDKELHKIPLTTIINTVVVTEDRIAVLEKDHQAIERLRNLRVDLTLCGDGFSGNRHNLKWLASPIPESLTVTNDPADAILAVEKEPEQDLLNDNDTYAG